LKQRDKTESTRSSHSNRTSTHVALPREWFCLKRLALLASLASNGDFNQKFY